MRYPVKQLLRIFMASCLFAVVSGAQLFGQGGISFDFNDPNDPRLDNVFFSGTAEFIDFGGVDDTGYLRVTDAENGASGLIVLPDLSPGKALESFQITADLRVGGGTDRPADGFSFNLVRPEDPLLEDPPGSYASSPVGEGNLPEEGSTTGLGIGFDEWQSGGADAEQNFTATGLESRDNPAARVVDPSCGPSSSLDLSLDAGRDRIEHDCIGISIRIDDELVAQAPFPILNGSLGNDQSLQTGPERDAFDLGWAKLIIQVTPDLTNENNSNIRITYKDREVINGSFAYRPSPGQLVFGGRTGGANSAHHIDNIRILTDFTRIENLGDFNEDGTIDTADFMILASNMRSTGEVMYQDGDIDFSGRIDLGDFVVFRKEFLKANPPAGGALAAVPEPGSLLLAILGLLGLALTRRRNRRTT